MNETAAPEGALYYTPPHRSSSAPANILETPCPVHPSRSDGDSRVPVIAVHADIALHVPKALAERYDGRRAPTIDALLPWGGYLVSLAHAYIDESGTDEGSPVLCLAGYVFHHERAMRFTSEWSGMLRRYDLPAFHMVDCNAGKGDFSNLSKAECIAVQTEAIRLIRKRTALGFAVTVNEKEYREIYGPLSKDRWSAYYFCLNNCLTAVAAWARRTNFDGRVAYFFEAGHKDQGVSNQRMTEIFASERLRTHFYYSSHTFGSRKDFPPLQAADILAWQWFKNTKRVLAGATRHAAICWH